MMFRFKREVLKEQVVTLLQLQQLSFPSDIDCSITLVWAGCVFRLATGMWSVVAPLECMKQVSIRWFTFTAVLLACA